MLDVIATPVATVLKAIHSLLSTFLIEGSGPAWAGSIILLTVVVRLLLFPLFVKQIKSQRRMQQLAPKIKELQKHHKGDRQTLNAEMMKLYKDNNANPISGCLPLLLQLPVFFALFTVLREFKPRASPKYGLTAQDLQEGGRAQFFGAPISAALNEASFAIEQLGGVPLTVRIVAVVMLVLMGATTFWTQRQMMVRAASSGTVTDPTQMQVQKVLLYVLPLSFAVFGYSFPIGVLLYWLTTNLWSMGQQAYVIKRMPPPDLGGSTVGAPRAVSSTGAVDLTKRSRGGSNVVPGATGPGTGGATSGSSRAATERITVGGGAPKRPQGSRKKKGRRGGRH